MMITTESLQIPRGKHKASNPWAVGIIGGFQNLALSLNINRRFNLSNNVFIVQINRVAAINISPIKRTQYIAVIVNRSPGGHVSGWPPESARRMSGNIWRRLRRHQSGRGNSARNEFFAIGIGWADAIHSGGRRDCRWRWPSAKNDFWIFWTALAPWTNTFCRRRRPKICQ